MRSGDSRAIVAAISIISMGISRLKIISNGPTPPRTYLSRLMQLRTIKTQTRHRSSLIFKDRVLPPW